MPYVFSTLTTSRQFNAYRDTPQAPGSPRQLDRSVTIYGGANLPDKFLRTPHGIATRISEEDLDFLRTHPQVSKDFAAQIDAGYISVGGMRQDERDADKVARDMQAKDSCAPLQEPDLAKHRPPKGAEYFSTSTGAK